MSERINPKSVAGDAEKPHTIWMRTSQVMLLFGTVSYLGINVAGVQVSGSASQFAPLVVILLAGFGLWYGTTLKKNLAIKLQQHEMAMASASKGTPPSRGDDAFLTWFETLKLPINEEDLLKQKFPYDAKRKRLDLDRAMSIKRLQKCMEHGKITRHDGVYDVTNADRTIIQ